MNAAGMVTKQMVVVSKSADLTALVSRLVDRSAWRTRAALPAEAAEWGRLADAMVVELPLAGRAADVAELRRRFSGPLIVIAQRGEGSSGLPDNDDGIVLLVRPFAVRELSAALRMLAAPARTSPRSTFSLVPTAGPGSAGPKDTADASPAWSAGTAEFRATADRSPRTDRAEATVEPLFQTRTPAHQPSPTRRSRFGPAAGLIPFLPRRRGPRVVLMATIALITFIGAFALITRGGCGVDCKDLTNRSPVQDPTRPLGPSGMTGSSGRLATGATANPGASTPPRLVEVHDGSASVPDATSIMARRSGVTTTPQRSRFGLTAPTKTTTAPPTTAPLGTSFRPRVKPASQG